MGAGAQSKKVLRSKRCMGPKRVVLKALGGPASSWQVVACNPLEQRSDMGLSKSVKWTSTYGQFWATEPGGALAALVETVATAAIAKGQHALALVVVNRQHALARRPSPRPLLVLANG